MCVLQVRDSDVEEPSDSSSPISRLSPELKLKIFQFLDFKTLSCVLPAVCREFFYLAKSVLENPVDSTCLLDSNAGTRQFLIMHTTKGVPKLPFLTTFGLTLETLDILGEADPRVRVGVNVCDFLQCLPNLKSLSLGNGEFHA